MVLVLQRKWRTTFQEVIVRRWGMVITAFYGVLVVTLLWPLVFRLAGARSWALSFREVHESLSLFSWNSAILVLLVGGQALLLFLPVDTSWRRLKPRQHLWVSAAVAGWFIGLLFVALVATLFAVSSESALFESPVSPFRDDAGVFPVWLAGSWLIWSVAFYAYYRNASVRLTKTVKWLLAGSVLELLIAVPAHAIVRQREDCSAPVATGFGIATGLAVMLACFGPGVLALYRKRLATYRTAREKSAKSTA